MQLVVSAFPGTGKSTMFRNAADYGLKPAFVQFDAHTKEYELQIANAPGIPVFDSDSSLFDKAAFPDNYIKHIKNVLATCPNVVIFVSSHKAVREALREAGIEYCLGYPQIELKADYIERYIERGSSEALINMMEKSWVQFIESCDEDPTPVKFVLSEGEYLVKPITELLNKVGGMENLNPDEISASIVDVNADSTVVVVPGEPTGDPSPSLLDIPENLEASTLDAEKVEGGIVAVDLNTDPETDDAIVDPAVDPDAIANIEGTETIYGRSGPVDGGEGLDGETRLELIEAKFDMQNDLDVLEGVVEQCQDADVRAGLEGYEDEGAIFTAAAVDIQTRYGAEIPATLAGMEGFLDALKGAIKKVTEKLKTQPSKQELAVIKKFLFEADKAVEVYASTAWQDKQEFKNVGKAKFSVPQSMAEVTNPESVKTILNGFFTVIDKEHTSYLSNASQRMNAGLKVFNKFANKAVPEDMGPVNAEIKKLLPIKPEEKPAPSKTVLDALVNTAMVQGEIPVLRKDDIKNVVTLLQDMNKRLSKMEENTLDLAMDGISWSDIHDSDLWGKVNDDLSDEVVKAAEWENATESLNMLEEVYTKKMLAVAKFLEEWILYSVK